MGIIISSFVGCGKTFLTNTYGNKVKIFDATNLNGENIVDEVMSLVDEYDIVFIPSDDKIREKFNENNIDYDVFYPAKGRRGEFIENQVRKRTNPSDIRYLDKNFESLIQVIDNEESPNCFKHKLSNFGEFIGNAPIILQYLENVKFAENKPSNNSENNSENETK